MSDFPFKPYYTFKQLSQGEKVLMTSAAVAWPDLADRFYDFLMGVGFILGKQDLADHFDQSMFEKVAEHERDNPAEEEEVNHAEQFGLGPRDEAMEPTEEPENPQTKFANPPRLLYEFCVSDSGALTSVWNIWKLATRSMIEQQEFELNSGGSSWPSHRLAMVGYAADLSTIRYSFEVWSD